MIETKRVKGGWECTIQLGGPTRGAVWSPPVCQGATGPYVRGEGYSPEVAYGEALKKIGMAVLNAVPAPAAPETEPGGPA